MIERLVHFWLTKTGKGTLATFVNGLAHVGRPSSVLFPSELMEQGASLILTGLNNTMAFQSNPDWVGPYWYERQRDPASREFVPTGMNMVTSNLALRNWTSIGLPGSEIESIVDPVGMLTLKPYGWSVFPYLRLGGKNHLPPLLTNGIRQHLLEEVWPAVVTEYHVLPGLGWRSTARTIALDCEELVAFTHELENNTSAPLPLVFGLALRPYNTLNIAHINRIKLRDQLWRINHEPALWMLDKPSWASVSDRNFADPLQTAIREKEIRSHTSKSGIATGLAEFDLVLEPGERRILETVGTLRSGRTSLVHRFERPTYTAIQDAKDAVQLQWEKQSTQGMQLNIPDKKWQIAFEAVRNRLYIFDDGDHFSPGTYCYHHHWVRDSAFISLAYAALGWKEQLHPKAIGMLRLQSPDGYFRSQNGEWDSNGEAIFSLVNSAYCSGDVDILRTIWPPVLRACRWLDRKRHDTRRKPSDHFGLLPAGFSAEHFGPNDHYFWDNFWSLAGLRDALWLAECLGAPEKQWLQATQDEYRDDMQKAMALAMEKQAGRGLPSSPYRRMDCSAIGNLVAVAPLDLIGPDTAWLAQTAHTLWTENVHQGMFFQKIIHTGMNAYLSLQLARAFLALDDKRWQSLFSAVLDHASPTWTWPEAIHPGSQGGCMGDGDHGWAAAEIVSFLASLMVRVQQETLCLGYGIPRQWYQKENALGVKNCHTRAGTVSWEVVCQGTQATLNWEIKRNHLQRKLPAYFQLPVPQGLVQPYLTDHSESRRLLRLDEDCGSLPLRLL
jgi:hypothetical protein